MLKRTLYKDVFSQISLVTFEECFITDGSKISHIGALKALKQFNVTRNLETRPYGLSPKGCVHFKMASVN